MPSLIDIRRRIRTVRNTQQITKAMKMVSAAKLRRAQDRVLSSRPYAHLLREVLGRVAAAVQEDERLAGHPLLAAREQKRVQLVLITADRGLAGAFNSNLIKAAQRFIEERGRDNVLLEAAGRKGIEFFRKRGYQLSGEHSGTFQKTVRYADAASIAGAVMERFQKAEIDAVYLLYNEFKSVVAQKVTLERVLPVEIPRGQAPIEYIYEQPADQLLGQLLPRFVEIAFYQAALESSAAEHAARMTAMDAASTNAGDVIDRLTLFMNRVRQASITKEIIEVVSGAAALE